jgi:DNA-binding NtrC family response regulator
VLKSNGYKVFAAASGAQALEEWSPRVGEIDLLLTDMVMPGGVMGRELAERMVAKNNRLKTIYTSGYSPGMAGKDVNVFEEKNFLAKPYGPNRLLQKVRDCLDEQTAPA